MMNLEEIKKDRELIKSIDWEITPRLAFETYQLKAVDNWRHGALSPVLYFYLSVWKGEPRANLVRRGLKESEEIAEIQAPEELVRASAAEQDGEQMPTGQLPLGDRLRDWLREQLDA